MAQTINPAVSGSRTRSMINVWAYFFGVAVGWLVSVALVLFAFGALSLALPRAWLIAVAIVLAVAPILRDLGVPVPLPYRRQQVPERWRELLPLEVASFLYGAVLGFGFATLFTSSAHATVLLALPFLTSGWTVVIAVVLYALGKTVVLSLAAGTSSQTEVVENMLTAERFSPGRLWARRATSVGASLLVLGTLAATIR